MTQKKDRIEDVTFVRQDNLVIAIAKYSSDRVGVGVAKCHPNDTFDMKVGKKIAVGKLRPVDGTYMYFDETNTYLNFKRREW